MMVAVFLNKMEEARAHVIEDMQKEAVMKKEVRKLLREQMKAVDTVRNYSYSGRQASVTLQSQMRVMT